MHELLVLDSETQAGLAVIRSLGERGLPVTAASSVDPSLGMVSKASSGRFVHPDPEEDYRAFIDALVEHLEENDYYAVFPVSDQTTTLVAKNKPELERTGTVVASEDWETFSKACDKAKTFEFVDDIDVPTPATVAPDSVADLEDRCDELHFPVVIKSRSKSVWGEDNALHLFRVLPNDYVHTKSELLDRYRSMLEADDTLRSYPPIVQEVIEGETTTTTVLADEGDIQAYFQERRLRTFPATGGNSTLLEGMHDTRMLTYARRIIEKLAWTGPAQVEFMRAPDGEYYLIEVNGRYWGSLPLAIESGVDFPWLHYRLLRGLSSDLAPYRTDVTQRRLLFGDIKWLIEQIENQNPGAVVPFARDFFTTNHTFVSLSDPAPTSLALKQAAELGISTVKGREAIPHDQW